MKAYLALIVAVVLLQGCAWFKPVPPPAPIPPAGATCADACNRLRQLNCEAGQPTANGATCEMICANVDDTGIEWKLDCMMTAASCDKADACAVVKPF